MTSGQSNVAALIIAGGQSSRMGADKAAIVWQGETLLESVVRRCREVYLKPVIIVGRERPIEWTGDEIFILDDAPQSGPLGGLAAGLRYLEALHSSSNLQADVKSAIYALALPCDMPLIDTNSVRWLKEIAEECTRLKSRGAVATTQGQQIQPLFAVYSTALLPAIDSRLNFGKRSLVALIESEALNLIPAPQNIADAIISVNTPQELAELERLTQ